MKRLLHLVPLLVWVLAPIFPAPVSAQTAPAEKPPLKLRFYYAGFVFPAEETNPQAKFLLLNGKDTVSLRLNPDALSSEIDYVGQQPISLFRQRMTANGPTKEELGALSVPPGWKGVLFLVTRDPSNPRLPFRFFPIEYWAPSIPAGHARVMNLCPYPLAARVGSSQAMVASSTTSDLAFPAGGEVALGMAAQAGGKWVSLLSTSIVRPENGRMLFVVFPNPAGAPRIVTVRDIPDAPQTQANLMPSSSVASAR